MGRTLTTAAFFASLLGCGRFEEATSQPSGTAGPPGEAGAEAGAVDGGGTSDAAPRSRTVFVTAKTTKGNMSFGGPTGGRAAADAQCNAEARVAMLAGTFVAWLSLTKPNEAAISRLTEGPAWSIPGVGVAFPSLEHIKALTAPLVAINRDAQGKALPMPASAYVYTGTSLDLKPVAGSTCEDWTVSGAQAAAGGATFAASAWSFTDILDCAELHHIICFEQ